MTFTSALMLKKDSAEDQRKESFAGHVNRNFYAQNIGESPSDNGIKLRGYSIVESVPVLGHHHFNMQCEDAAETYYKQQNAQKTATKFPKISK